MAIGLFNAIFGVQDNASANLQRISNTSKQMLGNFSGMAPKLQAMSSGLLKLAASTNSLNAESGKVSRKFVRMAQSGNFSERSLEHLAQRMEIVAQTANVTMKNKLRAASNEILALSNNAKFLKEQLNEPTRKMGFLGDVSDDAANKMRGISAASQGMMLGMSLAQRNVTGLAFSLIFLQFLHQHINLFVYGHTANTGGHPITMFRYFDPMEKSTQNINTMFSVHARSNNADGYAIAHMGDVLAKGKAKQKVLIVASDGYPSASGYGGTPAIKHTAQMVKKLETQGVFVVQIAMEDINSAQMFTNFIPYDKNSLGMNLKKILVRKLVEISNLV